jgi:DNA-3-methyladenine glycosylase II
MGKRSLSVSSRDTDTGKLRLPMPPGKERPLTQATLAAAVAELAAVDGDLSEMVDVGGVPPMWPRRPGFATLARIILEQQVTLASGAATYRRISDALGRVTPGRVLGRTHHGLRRLGVTRQKARYLRELARAVADGDLDLGALSSLPCDEVRQALTRVLGIGRWTADIYLLMALRRPDVWPRGDLALDQTLGALARDPETCVDRWRPWRSVAARILWHHYLRNGGP